MTGVHRLRWWIAGTCLVLVVLAGGAVQIWRNTHPRAATVATVTPALDRAIAAVVAAVGTRAAVTVTELVPATSCPGGSVFTVTANLYTVPGGEGPVIAAIAATIPSGEQPHRSAALGGGAPSLDANLGGGATLQVIQLDQGWISATARSGCRAAAPASAPPAPPGATAALTTILGTLGSAPVGFHTDAIGCASGAIVTVSTASGPMNLANVHARLATLPPAGTTVFTSPSDRIAWREGSVSTVIAAADDGTHVTAQQTTSC